MAVGQESRTLQHNHVSTVTFNENDLN